jgi:hypothetical protein
MKHRYPWLVRFIDCSDVNFHRLPLGHPMGPSDSIEKFSES